MTGDSRGPAGEAVTAASLVVRAVTLYVRAVAAVVGRVQAARAWVSACAGGRVPAPVRTAGGAWADGLELMLAGAAVWVPLSALVMGAGLPAGAAIAGLAGRLRPFVSGGVPGHAVATDALVWADTLVREASAVAAAHPWVASACAVVLGPLVVGVLERYRRRQVVYPYPPLPMAFDVEEGDDR